MASISTMAMEKTAEILGEFSTELLLFGMAFVAQFILVNKPWRKKDFAELDSKQLGEKCVEAKAVCSSFKQGDHAAVLRYWRLLKQKSDQAAASVQLVVQVLESMLCLRRSTIAVLGEIEEVLRKNTNVTVQFMNDLLPALTKSSDGDLISGAMALFSKHGVQAESSTYEILLQMHFSMKRFQEVKRLGMKMRSDGIKPTHASSLVLLKTVLVEADLDTALQYVREVHCAELADSVCEQLVELACYKKRLAELLHEIEAAHIPMSTHMLDALLSVGIRAKDDCQVAAILQLASRFAVGKSARTVGLLIKAAGNDATRISRLLDEAEAAEVVIDSFVVDAVLSASADIDLVLVQRLSRILSPKDPAQLPAILSLIRYYVHSGHAEKACGVYDELLRPRSEASHCLPLDARTKASLLVASEACHRQDIADELGGASEANRISMVRNFSSRNDVANAVKVLDGANKLPPGAWNIALGTCIENGDLAQAQELMQKMAGKGVADQDSYSSLIKAYLHEADFPTALKLLKKMRQDISTAPTEALYSEIIIDLLKNGFENKSQALQLVEMMKGDQLRPSKSAVGLLLKSLTPKSTNAEINNLVQLVDLWKDQMDEGLLCALLETCVRLKKVQLLEQMLQKFYGTGELTWIRGAHSFGTLIKAYSMVKDVSGAWRCWKKMCVLHIKPTSITIGCMVEAIASNGDADGAHELIKSLLINEETRKQINAVIYGSILKAFSRTGHMDRAWAAFEEMQANGVQPTIMSFNAIIDGCARNGQMDRAVRLRTTMASHGVQPNLITQSTLIKGFWANGNINEAFEVFEEMGKSTENPDDALYSTMLDGCLKNGLVEEGVQLVDKMVADGICPSTYTMTVHLKLLSQANQTDKAFEVVEAVQRRFRRRVAASVRALLLTCCLKSHDYERGARVCLAMMTDGLALDGVMCRSLLQKLLQTRKPELAADVLRGMLSISKMSDLVDELLISEVVMALKRKGSPLAEPFLKELKASRPSFVLGSDRAKKVNHQERGKEKDTGKGA
eukprot:TRINITY_DN1698_c0_g1_i1.p1 TRINITY_DN1698_c0_g1~~TRINITY_DN1698_c0_g1_i1.p1  ORF type:complete len:1025 (-),score=235.45 TRINITY_DN1698_c0_g1_i1:203-3277(-)